MLLFFSAWESASIQIRSYCLENTQYIFSSSENIKGIRYVTGRPVEFVYGLVDTDFVRESFVRKKSFSPTMQKSPC